MTKISWTDVTWNPTAGCSLASPGCTNCYAVRAAHRMAFNPNAAVAAKFTGTTRLGGNGQPIWTGRINLAEHTLLEPIIWRKPRLVFVNSMSDVFHEDVPARAVERIWAVMALAERHTFQVLTKRSERMCDWLNDPETPGRVEAEMRRIRPGTELHSWPLENVWIGVSVEDQRRADERIPTLLDCPAVVRFVSAEPLLGAVDLVQAVKVGDRNDVGLLESGLGWVIAGGESGPNARPMHTDWARLLRDQCDAANIAFFFKQVGAWTPKQKLEKEHIGLLPDGKRIDPTHSDALSLWNVGARAAGEFLDGEKRQSLPNERVGCVRQRKHVDDFGETARPDP